MSEFKTVLISSLKSLKFYTKIILIGLVGFYLLSGFYTVKQNEIAIVKRFGKIISSNVKPGLSYAIPWPIDRVEKIASKNIESIFIDDFAEYPTENSYGRVFTEETSLKTYLITGDNNIVNLQILIKYAIDDPIKYTQNFKNIKDIIESIATSKLLTYFTSVSIDDMLIKNRSQIQFKLKEMIQKRVTQLNTGIRVVFIDVKKISPPSFILPYFNDVINANIDKKKMIEEAKGYKTKIISDLRIMAQKNINEAESYANNLLAKTNGDVNKFNLQYQEYKKSPKVAYKKRYLEFLENSYPYLEKSIIVPTNIKTRISVIDK